MLTNVLTRTVLSAACVFTIAMVSSVCRAEDPVFSGPQVGEKLTAFEVRSVIGPAEIGSRVDPMQVIGDRPTLIVFVHSVTRPGIALTRAITAYADSQREHGVRAAVIWLSDDQAGAEAFIKRAQKSLQLAVPVGVSVDGGEGPGAYGLNRNVELTILIGKEKTVSANYALVQPSVSEGAVIAGQLAKLIDQPAPTSEQIQKLAYPGREMARRPNARRQATEGAAADSSPSPKTER